MNGLVLQFALGSIAVAIFGAAHIVHDGSSHFIFVYSLISAGFTLLANLFWGRP